MSAEEILLANSACSRMSRNFACLSSTWEEHLRHPKGVIIRLRNAGLTAKSSKCQFAVQRCVYHGHVVGSGTVNLYSKVKAVQVFPTPQSRNK